MAAITIAIATIVIIIVVIIVPIIVIVIVIVIATATPATAIAVAATAATAIGQNDKTVILQVERRGRLSIKAGDGRAGRNRDQGGRQGKNACAAKC